MGFNGSAEWRDPMFLRIRSWLRILAVVCFCGQDMGAVSGAIARSGSSSQKKPSYSAIRRRDAARDAKTPAKPLARPQTVYRYTTKRQAQMDMRKGLPPGKHMTANASAGRPPSSATAMKSYGLNRQPTGRETIVLPKGQPVRTNKVLGGTPGRGEITSTRRVQAGAMKKWAPISKRQKK